MARAILFALCSLAVAATSSIAMSATALAADAVVEDYPPLAAYYEFCRMPDYRARYPVFCASFFNTNPCAADYACDEHSYPLTYDSYREYHYEAPLGDPYRGGTAYCDVRRPYSDACVDRGRY